jgi:histidine ammonia-lyase
MIYLGKDHPFGLKHLQAVLSGDMQLGLTPQATLRLNDTRAFVDHLLSNNIKVYGITTGFADLRHQAIDPTRAAELSCNLIQSHDAGIGASLPQDLIFAAMVVRASSLAKGHSGFQLESLKTLMDMIRMRIIPLVPKTGSLGASGDLAFLARVGRAMMGQDVPVWYDDKIMPAKAALQLAGIRPFSPTAKEGLAMTNGTSFMIAGLAIAYTDLILCLENILAMQGLFLNSIGAIDAAFNACIQDVRKQQGQSLVAKIIYRHFENSPFIDFHGVQDDYCIRCMPQLLGSKIEAIMEQKHKIENELDAVTDNPLLFHEDEISPDVHPDRVHLFNDERWVVLSGGNFHGECITTICDIIASANAKIALTLERQITYMLNPYRNKSKLPTYLIPVESDIGLRSGYMITQYTANALTQKIAQLGMPTSIFNITSANESEDVVSYGATAVERLLEQIALLKEFNSIYCCVALQAYALTRKKKIRAGVHIPESLLAEQIFHTAATSMDIAHPFLEEESFENRYAKASNLLSSQALAAAIGNPLSKELA